MIVMMMMMEMKWTTGTTAAHASGRWFLISCIAKSNVTFYHTGSSCTVGQWRGWLRRWRLGLRLLLLRVLGVMLMLGILYRWCGDRFVYGNASTFLVQGATVKIALGGVATVGTVDGTTVSRYRLMYVIRTLGCMYMYGGTLERIGALFNESTCHTGMRLLLLLMTDTGDTDTRRRNPTTGGYYRARSDNRPVGTIIRTSETLLHHIVMIYHSDLGTAVTRRTNAIATTHSMTHPPWLYYPVVELVQARLYHQRRSLYTTDTSTAYSATTTTTTTTTTAYEETVAFALGWRIFWACDQTVLQ